ncbi:hypothetical protein [Candidatus Vampirococcus lugosii]|uniref:DOD-type homing endonuclease domain-containing protein n=1 Tax=Candidatus Vampirococcus lugosii TaxID=2789015 RepID=A0ABS5QM32_9BACT|nr:hypothetical protein [Candidatus Vampirococcus lugosii]MBS8122129.1 hypothetical protein [Candidatus Vampirococcus lugosii]
MKKTWTKDDINFLIEKYPLYGREYCSINLDRTKESIYSKVKELKINRKFLGQSNKWSLNEIDFLRTNYSTYGSELVAKELNREISDIIKKANSLNIKYSDTQHKLKNNRRGFKLRSNKVNYNTFLKFNTPEIVYILGLIWGDGNINVNLSRIVVNMIESDMIELIDVFRKTGDWNISKPIKKFFNNKRVNNQLCVSTHNILLVNELIKYKFDLKSYINPQILLEYIDKIYHSYFFRGFFGCRW